MLSAFVLILILPRKVITNNSFHQKRRLRQQRVDILESHCQHRGRPRFEPMPPAPEAKSKIFLFYKLLYFFHDMHLALCSPSVYTVLPLFTELDSFYFLLHLKCSFFREESLARLVSYAALSSACFSIAPCSFHSQHLLRFVMCFLLV